MELFSSALKAVVMWPLFALIDVPFVQFGSRLLKLRRRSFGAIYLLVLIIGGVSFLASLVLSLVLPENNSRVDAVASIILAGLVSSWAFGYFLTDADGASIGYWKGAQLFLVTSLLFFALLVVLVIIGVGVTSVWKS
jgi:hypothetical protein